MSLSDKKPPRPEDLCPNCLTQRADGARYCHQCGLPVTMAEAGVKGGSILLEIFAIAKSLSATLDLDALLRRIGESAERLTQAEASSILLLDEDKQHLYFKVATGEKGGVVSRIKVKVGSGIAGWVAQERKPLRVEDVAKDPRFTGSVDEASGFKTKSILCIPMVLNNELVGVVEALNKASGSAFTSVDQEILESLAGYSAVAISNARLVEGLRNFYANVIEILIAAIESQNPKMVGHSWRVAQITALMGRKLGLSPEALKDLYYASLLHDIGYLKVGQEQGAEMVIVTDEARRERMHPHVGARLLENIALFRKAGPIVRYHHEAWDGTGYPSRVKGDAIPLESRILILGEFSEELRMQGYGEDQVTHRIRREAGRRLDPQVVNAYLEERAGLATHTEEI